ncbi:MAG: 5-(carboxyamino)imidazole ribonucleotide mutase [Phycisphaeraceae bacterium]|nr:5-(carboxyamino)imidazole ribonucleotide mutase [Phycisphaeraceae bacterium]
MAAKRRSSGGRNSGGRLSVGPVRRGSARGPALVGIIMGSQSDWPTMRHAAETLDELGVPYEAQVVSAHRTPDAMFRYAESAAERGLEVIIAGAGGAAHLPGMTASKTSLPVLGVPIESAALRGIDSLLSIAQMPPGIPVGTLAIGRAGAINAALLAAAIVGCFRPAVAGALRSFRSRQTAAVMGNRAPKDEPPARQRAIRRGGRRGGRR